MAVRLAALLPRAVIVALVWILATAAFTFAADSTIVGPARTSKPTAPAAPQELVAPSVVGQAYVFAKGILEDAGFAWQVKGSVRGYSSNRVLTQSPAPATRVVDTGAPTVTLRLVRGPYEQLGTPVDSAPYRGTAIRLADLAAVKAPAQKPAKKAPAAKKAKKVAKAPVKKVGKPPAKKVTQPKRKPAARPPAFTVEGAPREPLDEITLPARAMRLEAWIAGRARTGRNVQHWLYQHAWIVTGAQFGWWHGAEALQTLIRVDERVQREWGIGRKSEAVARAALAKVRRRAR
ncbi:MAG TPA: PASTA domain-containing protein [Solirubrobacteraceae bacterium]|nr:PASTA domain-containing protein [Solirubrobacteraceae bacterium]